MPELPEVETIIRGLRKKVIGRTITSFWTDTPSIIKKPTIKKIKKEILGLKILGIKRIAKNIIFKLSEEKIMLIHQKISGHLLYGKWEMKKNKPHPLRNKYLEDKENQYIRVIFGLDNGYQMALSDLRKFAKIIFGKADEILNLPEIKELGPDPLEKSFDFEKFKVILKTRTGKKRTGKIKQILMNQKIISGIGNIYSDEILWRARIHPLTPANKLSEKELKKIFEAMKEILSLAVEEGGSSVSDYRDVEGKKGGYQDIQNAYGREGEDCRRCGKEIERIKIGNRSSYFCPKCQVFEK